MRDIWVHLQSQSASGFFTSWGWIEVWLASLPTNQRVELVVLSRQDTLVGCFFLGLDSSTRHGLFYRTRASLNETGDEEMDELTIEYNAVLGHISKSDWLEYFESAAVADIEEYRFSNITDALCNEIPTGERFSTKSCVRKPSFYVDLAAIRTSEQSYLQSLSRNKRSQIRQSLNYYDKSGGITIRQAETVDEAITFLSALIELHQQRWASLGKPGAFASDYFEHFHRKLIETRFSTGEIQMLSFATSDKCIGYLYNFVYAGVVYYYQSGFSYESSSSARPGIVCHYLAVTKNLNEGRQLYNFLAGDSQYKRSLSTHEDTLYTLEIVRSDLKWTLEKCLRAVKNAIAG